MSLIIAIVAGIATPKFADAHSRSQLRAAAARLAADIRYARQQAKLSGSTQRVQFFPATNAYELPDAKNINGPGQNSQVFLSELFSASLVSASFGPTGTDTTVVFDMYGKPDYGGSVVLSVAGMQRSVQVEALAGKVSIGP